MTGTGEHSRFLNLPRPSESVGVAQEISGVAFRFSLLLPVLAKGREVFTKDDEEALIELLTEDFGGCTYTAGVTHPLLEGTWLDECGDLVSDKHTQFVVYASQTKESEQYFLDLQNRLQVYGKQEKVLVEMITVRLL